MHPGLKTTLAAMAALAVASCGPVDDTSSSPRTQEDALATAQAVAPMTTPRSGHTATLLLSGQVLLTGGYTSGSAPTSTAEVYDPVGRTFTAVRPMRFPRASHQATLLRTGKVLVVGGECATSPSSSIGELYDPATGLWTTTGALRPHCANFTATLLPSGKVLVVGGRDRASAPWYPTGFVDLYDPAVGTAGAWYGLPSLGTPRWGHTATLLTTTQEVLVAGGWAATPTASLELFNLATSTWSYPPGDNGASMMRSPRALHSATALSGGSVLLAGGHVDGSSNVTSTAEVYWAGPKATYLTPGTLSEPRVGHAATLLRNGLVFVAGGSPGGTLTSRTTEAFDPAAQVFVGTSSMTMPRSGHTATLLASGDVLIAGGLSGGVPTASAELFTAASGCVPRAATYDYTLRAPRCPAGACGCDTGALVDSRGAMAGKSERSQPNTIAGSCADGSAGTYHSDESIDRILVASANASALGAGPSATVTVTAYCYGPGDYLDLYHATNASAPAWTPFATGLPCTARGIATFTRYLPLVGRGTQAIRAQLRWGGAASSCSPGVYDDHDDVVLDVACAPGLSACGDGCVDLSSDNLNCGACGNACPGGAYCAGGSCGSPACQYDTAGACDSGCGERCLAQSWDHATCAGDVCCCLP